MPDDVVLTNKSLPDQPIVVPEDAVAGHEFYGWKRANKSMQANADQIRVDATPPQTAQEG